MGNTIKKITIHFVLFALYMTFGIVMIYLSMLPASSNSEDEAWQNFAYLLRALLVFLIISFLAQGFIREGYPLVRVSLITVFIFIVLSLGGYIYNYLEWRHVVVL